MTMRSNYGGVPLPSEDELAQIPRLGLVALAARICRRSRVAKETWCIAAADVLDAAAGGTQDAVDLEVYDKQADEASSRLYDMGNASDNEREELFDAFAARGCSRAIHGASLALGGDRSAAVRMLLVALEEFNRSHDSTSTSSWGEDQAERFSIPLRQDVELVIEARRQGLVGDDDPVDPAFFGPLWAGYKYYETDRSSSQVLCWEEPSDDHEIVLELTVPPGIDEAEVIARVREAALLADELHRAHGGQGLRVRTVECFRCADSPVEVPT